MKKVYVVWNEYSIWGVYENITSAVKGMFKELADNDYIWYYNEDDIEDAITEAKKRIEAHYAHAYVWEDADDPFLGVIITETILQS